MKLFVRGVLYGFAFSLGAALFKRVQDQLGLPAEENASSNSQQAPAPDDDDGDDDGGGDAALTPA